MAQTLMSFWAPKKPPAPPDPAVQPSIEPPVGPKSANEPRPSLKVTLSLSPESLRSVQPTKHSFFAPKKYTHKEKAPQLTIKQRHWSSDPIQQVVPAATDYQNRLQRRVRQEYAPSERAIVPIPSMKLQQVHKCTKRLLPPEDLEKHGASQQTPFDIGQYEKTLWTSKFAPKSYKEHINRGPAREIARWLHKRFKNMKTRPLKKKKRSFTFEEFEDEQDQPFLIIHGPRGCGKTSAVYAACEMFSALTVEINQSVRKSGATLKEVLSGLTQSHIVHANAGDRYHCAVLIDEAEIDLDQDTTFWSTLRDFAEKSKRPIVLTCESLNLPPSVLDSAKIVYMPKCEPIALVQVLSDISLKQGYMLEKKDLAKLILILRFDLRACLMHLNFWCQMGVGGSFAATEWLARAGPNMRILSDNNLVELPPVWMPASEPQEFEELRDKVEQLSRGLGEDYFKRIRQIQRDWHMLFPIDPLESSQKIIVEILPMMRDIARGDLDRRAASQGRRRTKRSLESFGLEKEVLSDPDKVLATWY